MLPSLTIMASGAELPREFALMYRQTAMKAAGSGSKGLWAELSPHPNMHSSCGTEEYFEGASSVCAFGGMGVE